MTYAIGLVVFSYLFFMFYALIIFTPAALLAWFVPGLKPLAVLPFLLILYLSGMRAHFAALIYVSGTSSFVEAMVESGEQLKSHFLTTPWLNRILTRIGRNRPGR